MRENNNKSLQEIEPAFAVTVLLLNASILAAVFGIGFLIYQLVTGFDQFAYFLKVV